MRVRLATLASALLVVLMIQPIALKAAGKPGTPTNASPANGATNISTSPTLTWTSSGATSYDVKFGTTTTPPVVASNISTASLARTGLVAGQKYFWQVVAKNSKGSTTGTLWSFTTTPAPPPPPPPDDPILSRAGWTVTADSQETTGTSTQYPATNAIDGNTATLWHTAYRQVVDPQPHQIVVDMQTSYDVSGFKYLPRQDGYTIGNIAQYEFYVSADGVTWGTAVATGTWGSDSSEKTVKFTPKAGRYVKLRSLSNVNGDAYTSVDELNVMGATNGGSGGGGGGTGTDYGGYRPSYQGFGVNTPGGRGGSVCRVTSLADSGTGTLRACIGQTGQTGPRFVIFETSGTIVLTSELVITQPYLTIAGQTAPSPGIAVKGPGIDIDTHDVVMQHLRLRSGQAYQSAVNLWVRDDAQNIVIDHVSASWGTWDNVGVSAITGGHPPNNVTFTDSLFYEPLACSNAVPTEPCDPAVYPNGREYSNSRNVTLGDGWGHQQPNVAIVRTIHANANDRQPEMSGGAQKLLMNNLYYNISLTPLSAIFMEDYNGTGPIQAVIKNNILIPGPTTPGWNGYVAPEFPEEGDLRMIKVTFNVTGQVYLDGNFYTKDCGGTACLATPSAQWVLANNQALDWNGVDVRATTPPFTLPSAPLSSAMLYSAVEASLTAHSGARPKDRDVADARIIAQIANRTGRTPNLTTEVAGAGTDSQGYPILAVNTTSLTVPANPNSVATGQQFRTNIEMWLESLAQALE